MSSRAPITRKVIAVPPSLHVEHAWRLMQSERIRHLPVVQDGLVVGMVSDRDLLRCGEGLPSGELHFVRRHLEDVMTLKPIVCGPDASVSEVARTMTTRKIDALPVVDETGHLVGLVTSTDLLRLLIDSPEPRIFFDFQIETVGALPA